jgi:peptidoglycan/LPS O-acetylase OafA/YrhL
MKMERKSESTNGRLPSLDGLRAISIVMVILGHLSGTRGFRQVDLGIGNYAHLGVVVFFVISGFLITSLLISEEAARRRISLKLFYARRTLRIFPASYAYLITLSLLCCGGAIKLPLINLVCAFTYTINYLPNHAWQVGHLWSLSVEEQFYLLWPFGFAVLKARKGRWAAICVMIVAVISRVANRLFLVGTPFHDLPMFPMVADSLATGCVLALSRNWLEKKRWYLQLFHPIPSILLVVVILWLNRLAGYTLVNVFGTSVINIAVGLLIHRSVYHHSDAVGKLLNWRPLTFVGVLSYSLYLWQQLFLDRSSMSSFNAFPQNVVLAVGAAFASYYLIERPLLGFRRRLRAKSITSSKDPASIQGEAYPTLLESRCCPDPQAR